MKQIRVGQTIKTARKRTKRGSVKQEKTQEEKMYKIKQEAKNLNPKP